MANGWYENLRRPHERDYLERTIATVRQHKAADNMWPQWSNIFADEIERLWEVEKQRDGYKEEKALAVRSLDEADRWGARASSFLQTGAVTGETAEIRAWCSRVLSELSGTEAK